MIVKGSTPEYDYPQGKDNVYANYDGVDGISQSVGTAWRSLFAWYFDDVNILLSSYITSDSRIMLHRNIQDRVHMIAPFLQLDRDPYVVITKDGSTECRTPTPRATGSPTPSATRRRHQLHPQFSEGGHRCLQRDCHILRSGRRRSDRRDLPAHLPLCSSRSMRCHRICKGTSATLRGPVQHPSSAIPHVPHEAPKSSTIAKISGSFPVSRPLPDGMNARLGTRMAPYYIMMRLPGEPRAEFFLMLPMVPSQRENMIAWLAARLYDLPDYGKFIVYEFPKDKLIYPSCSY